MTRLAVVVLTYNEIAHIHRCLEGLAGLADEVFVVDSLSDDGTPEAARALGAVVLSHPFTSHARQLRWALDHLPTTAEWLMRLDADERVEPALAAEIRSRLPALPSEVAGVNLRRKHVFLGRAIRHGGRYPLVLLRIWRRGQARVEDRWMDEHVVVEGGRTVTFAGDFRDENLGDLTAFTQKHNGYATREALDVVLRTHGLGGDWVRLTAANTSRRASLTRLAKERVYNRLPFWLAAPAYFLYRYLVRLGFLDGIEGLIYHALQGGWYRFLVGAKVRELERALTPIEGREARRAALERLTGCPLDPSGEGRRPENGHIRMAPLIRD